jgi:phosphohistidine phosphatase SixA
MRMLITVLLSLVSTLVSTLGVTLASARAEPAAALVERLRQGGYVLYARHAISEGTEADPVTDLGDCGQQRNLSDAGRTQAREIGAKLRALGIPVGPVLSSAYCRCLETARIAFGEPEVSPLLYFAAGATAADREQQSARLRALLATPVAGSNRVLVSHTSNLKEAVGIAPALEGEIHVFQPKADGTFQHLGAIEPGAWAELATPPGVAAPSAR